MLSLSDLTHTASYTQLEFPAIKNAVITVQLLPVTVPTATFIEWYCTFDIVEGDEKQLVNFIVSQVYEPCFVGLAGLFTGPPAELASV